MVATYALITPARNEQDYIGHTLQSVVQQTVLPQRWIIVNDRSTDHTASIVADYADRYSFIHLISVSGDQQRNFGSKSKAIAHAYEQLADVAFDFVGNLDADIGLDPCYYECILAQLEANPRLGIAGGIRYDLKHGKFELRDCARNSVGGPIQLFRRACYEEIGGYMPLSYGGIDAVAEISARMHGWEVRSFPEYRVYHYRATGTASQSSRRALYRAGLRDYTIGYHPLFEVARTFRRMKDKPYVIGAWITFAGYLSALVRRLDRPVSPELVAYLHSEQMQRLKNAVTRRRSQL
jgi:biofilm PGA synthesis N-glycosyltransferase PgaC